MLFFIITGGKMFKQIFLDMDGVLVDFDGGVRREFNCDWWYPTEWSIPYRELGFSREEFWQELDYPEFWEHLPWTEDGKEILSILVPYKPCILSHSRLPNAFMGKWKWLQREIPDVILEERVLMGWGKVNVAHPNAILIDDSDHIIEEWERRGGLGILYPRPWNKGRNIKYPLEYLSGMLMFYLSLEATNGTNFRI
jgi:5'(3')-deoxyribonucleotidase